MNLVIFHYHFLTGGVTRVVTEAVKSFRRYLRPELNRITLAAGRIPNPQLLAEELDVDIKIIPAIDYLDPDLAVQDSGENRLKQAKKLASLLLKEFGSESSLWWVHNYHIGKNPVFTEALLSIIQSGFPQKMLLQIHDFPECGRLQNLKLLKRILTLPPYPISPHVHYSVLNIRDMDILLNAGIPSQSLSLLENPISPYQPGSTGKPLLKRKLACAFSERFPSFNRENSLFFYPARAIRRKNVFEAAFIAKLLGNSVSLLVSLPGISKKEAAYSRMVETAYRNGSIKGLWKIGTELNRFNFRFEDLVGASDLVLSSSTQEGFGYLFINALQWRLPLIARDLDTLSGLKDLFIDYPAYFYQSILYPLKTGDRKKIISSYNKKLRDLRGIVPDRELSILERNLQTYLEEEMIDFSYLPAELQVQIIRDMEDKKYCDILKEVNQDLLRTGRSLMHSCPPDRNEQVLERFGYKRYTLTFKKILDSLNRPSEGANTGLKDIQAKIIQQFAKKECLRLLYD